MIKLYFREKTRAVRPRWLLEELGLDYELQRVDIFRGEGQSEAYRQIHPLGQIPALEIDGKVQFESGAICHWLADQYPEKGLAPAPSAPARAQYEQWFFYGACSLDAPAFVIVQHVVTLPKEQRVAAILPWANALYQRQLPALEAQLQDRAYLLGEAFSAADIMVGNVLTWLPRALKPHPNLRAYVARLRGREAYQRAMAPPTV